MAVHQLQYGSQARLYRRVIRRVAIFICLAAVAAGLFYLLRTRVMMWRRQVAFQPVRRAMFEQCLNHTYPPRTLIFDEATDAVNYLSDSHSWALHRPRLPALYVSLQQDGFLEKDCWWKPHNSNPPTVWNQLVALDETVYQRCMPGLLPLYPYSQVLADRPYRADDLFSQGRRASDGQQRLLLIGFDPPAFTAGSRTPFRVQVVNIGRMFDGMHYVVSDTAFNFHFDCPVTQPLQLYAGQADPADESHCTIDYATPAGAGVIDAWLLPGDKVKMSVRNGPAKGSQTQITAIAAYNRQ